MGSNPEILNPHQRLGLVVMASQDDIFYPLAKLSYDEIISFEAKVKRMGIDRLCCSADKRPTLKGVSDILTALRLQFPPPGLPCISWTNMDWKHSNFSCVS